LDALAFPMIYVSPDRAVQWANKAGETLLRNGAGLVSRNGKLYAKDIREDEHLQQALSGARRDDGYNASVRVTMSGDGSTLSLMLIRPPQRLRRAIGISNLADGFLVFVALDPSAPSTLVTRIQQAWGLTNAEAKLAVNLLEADKLESVSEKLEISRNTAKSQLASLFPKAGVRRQSELVRKLVAMAAIRDSF